MTKNWLYGLLILLGVALAAQAIPVTRTNPSVTGDFDGPVDVRQVLRTACYNCHSNETKWPAYSDVAPFSWLVAHDVKEGREGLNFSRWTQMPVIKRMKMAREVWEEVEAGEMPPLIYRLAHPEARLDEASKETLHTWSVAFGGEVQEEHKTSE